MNFYTNLIDDYALLLSLQGEILEFDSTKLFNSFSKPHTKILEFTHKQISNEFILEITYNIRDEASVDLILRKINSNWKIGIAVEVTSDLTESGVKNRRVRRLWFIL